MSSKENGFGVGGAAVGGMGVGKPPAMNKSNVT